MRSKMEELMAKKSDGKELDPTYKSAKMSMLQALRDEMSGMMKGDLENHGMKKVEVASNDKEGLAKGLDKAKEMLEGSPEEESAESPEEENAEDSWGDEGGTMGMESPDEEGKEEENGLSEEDMAHLQRLLAKSKQANRG